MASYDVFPVTEFELHFVTKEGIHIYSRYVKNTVRIHVPTHEGREP